MLLDNIVGLLHMRQAAGQFAEYFGGSQQGPGRSPRVRVTLQSSAPALAEFGSAVFHGDA